MLKKLLFLLAMVVLAAGPAAAQAPDEAKAFAKAKRDYDEGNYGPAREGYAQLVGAGSRNSAVFLNLGHANYRLGRNVEAAINYRRALALDPADAAARRSLEHVLAKLGVPGPGLGFAEIVGQYLPFDLLALGGSLLMWGGILVVVFAVFSQLPRRGAGFAGAFVAILGATAMVVAWAGDARISLAQKSVVTGEKVEARSTPADNAQKLASLPQGSEVTLVATRDDWSLVRLPIGVEGWVKSSELEPLVPAGGM